ncbi:MAG: glycosyltransferase family 39 protein [Selenomonadaceae bacterium]|nr:glycosyltransferase family 39 protein [Selenomonadaceae bacterium]
MDKQTSLKIIFLLTVVSIGLILRIHLYLDSPMYTTDGSLGYVHPDAGEYLAIGQYILEHGLINYFTNEISVRMPCGEPLYLVLIYKIFDGNFQHMRMFGIFVSCLNILLIYEIAKKMFNSWRVAILSALLFAVNYQIARYAYTFLTETLFLMCCSVFVYFYLLAKEKNNSRYMCIVATIFLFLATLTRAISMLMPAAIIFLYSMYFFLSKKTEVKSELRNWIVIGVIFYLLLTPFLIKNHFLFNLNNLCTGGGTALFLGSRVETYGDEPAFYGQTYECIYSVIGEANHRTVQSDKNLYLAGVENIKAHPLKYLQISVKKIARLTIGTNYAWFNGLPEKNIPSIYEYTKNKLLITELILQIFLFTVIYSFALFGIWEQRKNFYLNAMILIPLYFIVFSIPFLAILRYGIIILPFVTIFAAYEIVEIYTKKKYLLGSIGLLFSVLMFGYICLGY